MRTLFILLLLINAGVFAVGKGWFGEPRSQSGRTQANFIKPQIQPDALKVSNARIESK